MKDWACPECPASFDKQMGLSQHERHVHPITHNAERVTGDLHRSMSESQYRHGCWMAEEEETLTGLDMMFHGAWNINQLIAAELVTKTPRQISCK